MAVIEFLVPGIPIPQGSKTPWGSEANPHTKSWREAVAHVAATAVTNGPLLGPVRVDVTFTFPRPKSHFRTGRYAAELRADAPRWHTTTPDADKLQRALGDAFSGVVLHDDRQIAIWRVAKVYGRNPGATIHLETLEDV